MSTCGMWDQRANYGQFRRGWPRPANVFLLIATGHIYYKHPANIMKVPLPSFFKIRLVALIIGFFLAGFTQQVCAASCNEGDCWHRLWWYHRKLPGIYCLNASAIHGEECWIDAADNFACYYEDNKYVLAASLCYFNDNKWTCFTARHYTVSARNKDAISQAMTAAFGPIVSDSVPDTEWPQECFAICDDANGNGMCDTNEIIPESEFGPPDTCQN